MRFVFPVCAAALFTGAAPLALAHAQEGDAQAAPDRILVTGQRIGSYLRDDTPAVSLDRSALERLGAEDLTTALVRLPSVIGSEFNTDSATQNDTSGTANVNLRGLGLDATLVLVDGARVTVSSVNADDGATFVDLNALTPDIAIARVDVFADGGSALYGSDALAGVVNVVTRSGFEGLEIAAERRLATEYGDDASDWIVEGIWGAAGADWSLTAAGGYLDRKSLEGTDTAFTPGTGVSALGQPGAYTVTIPTPGAPESAPLRVTLIDQDCAAAGGAPLVTGDTFEGFGTQGFCQLDFGQFFSVMNNERRLQGWAEARKSWGETRGAAQFFITDNAIERGNSPSLPDLSFPALPANNPGNYFDQDVTWFGRPRGVEAGSARRNFHHLTYRVLGRLDGRVDTAARPWAWTATAAYSRNTVETTITDTLRDRFDAAIEGFGGPDCPADAADQGVAPGDQEAGCYWFNPFGSGGLVTDPADPRFNDPVVLNDILGEDARTGETDLATLDLVATTPNLFALPAGDVGAAFGLQGRFESTNTDHGADYNAENFLFILGGPDFSGERSAAAAFVELDAPVTATLRAQLAGRIDAYEDVSAASPRASLTWTPNAALVVTASASRSFRAPSLFETVSAATTLESLPVNGQNLFRAVTTVGSDDLDPVTSNAYTLGASWAKGPLTAAITAWRYDVEDLIVEESAQAIITADLADGVIDDPRVELAPSGDVRRVTAAFVNAPEVTTTGVDFAAGYVRDLGDGRLRADLSAAYLAEYTLTDPVTGAEISAEGQRNFSNFARSLPKLRALGTAGYARPGHEGALTLRYTSDYDDDQNGVGVASRLLVDAQYSLNVAAAGGVRATFSVLNVLNEEPPFVATPLGYDTKVHDPRGRIVSLRLAKTF